MVFPAAIREKSQCWVVFSCDAHSVSAGLGRIRQPCVQSSIGPRANFLKMFAILRGKPRKKDIKMIIVTFLHYLEFSCFGSSTRCSARSEIDFSWQYIWDLSKKFQFQEIHSSREETWKSRKSHIQPTYLKLWGDYSDNFTLFGIFVFWIKHKVLCEIWNKFPWQKSVTCQKNPSSRSTGHMKEHEN